MRGKGIIQAVIRAVPGQHLSRRALGFAQQLHLRALPGCSSFAIAQLPFGPPHNRRTSRQDEGAHPPAHLMLELIRKSTQGFVNIGTAGRTQPRFAERQWVACRSSWSATISGAPSPTPDRYDPGLNRTCAEMAKPGCRSGMTNRQSAISTLIWETPRGRGRPRV